MEWKIFSWRVLRKIFHGLLCHCCLRWLFQTLFGFEGVFLLTAKSRGKHYLIGWTRSVMLTAYVWVVGRQNPYLSAGRMFVDVTLITMEKGSKKFTPLNILGTGWMRDETTPGSQSSRWAVKQCFWKDKTAKIGGNSVFSVGLGLSSDTYSLFFFYEIEGWTATKKLERRWRSLRCSPIAAFSGYRKPLTWAIPRHWTTWRRGGNT